jgi:hypothetical protein
VPGNGERTRDKEAASLGTRKQRRPCLLHTQQGASANEELEINDDVEKDKENENLATINIKS